MGWSAQDAMKAYLNTLDMRKFHSDQQGNLKSKTTPLIEPSCMEFISALAAGNQAKLMVEITTQGITPLTLALAIAAKQTGGQLICIVVPHHDNIEKITSTQLFSHDGYTDLKKTIKFAIGNPCDIIKEYRNIEFAVIDGRFEYSLRLFKCIDVSERSVVIVNNKMRGISYAETVKRRIGVKSAVTLPIGEGMELTKIASSGRCSYKRSRFYVVEN